MRPGAGRPADAILLICVIAGGEAIGVRDAAIDQMDDITVITWCDHFVTVEDEDPFPTGFQYGLITRFCEVVVPWNGDRFDVQLPCGIGGLHGGRTAGAANDDLIHQADCAGETATELILIAVAGDHAQREAYRVTCRLDTMRGQLRLRRLS